jgi:hypothetical protein
VSCDGGIGGLTRLPRYDDFSILSRLALAFFGLSLLFPSLSLRFSSLTTSNMMMQLFMLLSDGISKYESYSYRVD